MSHKLVTELTPTCQLGVTAGERSVSGAEADDQRAERLEDVEKVVRNLEQRLSELEEWSIEITDRQLTRIEMLESKIRSMYSRRQVEVWQLVGGAPSGYMWDVGEVQQAGD